MRMTNQQESNSSASLQALLPFREQRQSTSGSSGAGFGGGGGSDGRGFGSHNIGFGGNNLFGGSNAGFGAGGFHAGNTANMTCVFGRNVSGFSMTLDGTNLRIDLAYPGSFGRPSGDDVFVKYRTDSGGPFGDGGSAIGSAYHTPKGFSALPYFPLAATQDGATSSQVPLTEEFQAHTEKNPACLAEGIHFQAITSSNPFKNLSFEELRLIDHHRGRYPNGIPDHGFDFDPKLRTNLQRSSLFGRPPSSDYAFVRYPANSGPFSGKGLALGAADLASLPYSPPAAEDGTPVQVPLTEGYQKYTEIENGVTAHFHAVTSSAPFRSISFEELRLVDYQEGRQQNALPDHDFSTNSNTSSIPLPKLPTLAFTDNKNPLPTSSTPAFGSAATGAGGLFRPSFAFGQRKFPPLPSGTFGFGSPPSFNLNATAAGSQGTFNHPFQAYAEQEPLHQYCYQTLGFLNPYKNSSLEELRLADYNQGRQNVVAFGSSVGSPRAEQVNPGTPFGKTVAAGGSGNQSVVTASPFNADQISSAIAQISGTRNSNTDQPWRSTEATPSGGRSSEPAIPGNGGSEATSSSSGEASKASDKPKLPDSCNQQ